MRRISHDMPGVSQRIQKLANEFEHCAHETQEVWRDEKGRAFIQRHISEIRPTIGQLASSLVRSVELFEEIAKRLRDPDAY